MEKVVAELKKGVTDPKWGSLGKKGSLGEKGVAGGKKGLLRQKAVPGY